MARRKSVARIPKQVQKLRDEQAKLGKLGLCKSLEDGFRHAGLHYRRDDCVEFHEVSNAEIAEDTFARFWTS